MSPSCTVHGGQHDTKYVTVELILHAAFAADEIWAICLKQLVRVLINDPFETIWGARYANVPPKVENVELFNARDYGDDRSQRGFTPLRAFKPACELAT